MSTHLHITAWVLGVILFFVALTMYKNRNPRAKMIHMMERLLYIIIIVTGLLLYMPVMKNGTGTTAMLYGFKMLAGIVVIGSIEMVLVRTKKGKATGVVWGLFVLAFIAVLYLGLRLPQGFHPFA